MEYPERTRIFSVALGAALLGSALTGAFFVYSGMYAPTTLGGYAFDAQEEMVINAVERASPSVVSVVVSVQAPILQRELDHRGPFGIPVPYYTQTGLEEIEVGGGSGFFVGGGYIVTNRHVVEDESASYTVFTHDGKQHNAQVVYRDEGEDIALMRIRDAAYPALVFGNSEQVRVGQTVIAIGNALAEFRNTVSVGVISGVERSVAAIDPARQRVDTLERVIQTDAAINRGNSGGPLLDLSGQVVGMNVAIARQGQNISFAIPAEAIQAVLGGTELALVRR